MYLDIANLLQKSGNRETVSETWTPEQLDLQNDLYSIGDSLEVSLLLYNAAGIIEVEGHYGGILEYYCNRCLEEMTSQLNGDVDARFYPPDRDVSEVVEDTDQEDLFVGNYTVDETIDVGTVIREDIVLNRPMQVLCRSDCKGLCPECGQNLNEYDCGHDQQSVDPRLSKLQDIELSEENEVSHDE